MLLMTLLAPWAVAQQALPYSYGFEDNDLSTDGWTTTCTSSSSGIKSDAARSGSYGFVFYYSEQNGALISPLLTGGDKGVDVSFWYKEYSNSYGDEQFYVGYTTDETVTDPDSFVYGNIVTATTSWQEYSNTFPAGTKRIAVKYVYNDAFYLFLDDFTFEPIASCPKPKDLAVTNITAESATLTWTSIETPSNGYNVRYREAEIQHPTFFDDFESNSLTGWTVYTDGAAPQSDGWYTFNPSTSGLSFDAHSGSYCASAWSWSSSAYNANNWLISPQVTFSKTLKFWVRTNASYPDSYEVLLSTTGTDEADFTETLQAMAPAPTTGAWEEVSIDLTAYSGTGYIAIHHVDNDNNYLLIDDFGIYNDPTPAGAWVNTTSNTNSKDINGLKESTSYDFEVQANCGGETSDWVASTFTTNPDCMPVANLAVSDATTTTISLTWTDQNSGAANYIVTDGDDNPVTVTNLTIAGCTVTGLTANTAYTFKVKADCGSSAETINARTDCDALSTLPYEEGFEASSVNFYCWDLDGFNRLNNSTYAHTGGYSIYSQEALAYAILPATTTNISDLMLNFWWYNATSGYDLGSLAVGYLTDETDYSTFVTVGTIDMSNSTDTYTTSDDFLFTGAPAGARIALKYTEGSSGAQVIIDDVTVDVAPDCMKPTDLEVTGGLNAVVSWTGTADSFDIAFSDDPTVDPKTVIVGNSTTNSFNLYEVVTLVEGDYTVWVRGNCGGSYSAWASTTLSLTYCTPNPTSHDSSGITGVSFGTGSYVVNNGDGTTSIPASAPFYGNYSSMIGAVHAGVESTIAITTKTGSYPYTFVIWVDLDNDFTFEDEEILYIGKAATGNGTLNATITVPATQTLGDYRMRIYGADSYFTNFYNNGTTNWSAAHDPCNSGTYRHANDYTIRVLEAPNCIAPSDLAATNITAHTAELSWTANSGETSWNIYYKKASDTDYTELTNVKENPYTLSGLNAGTDYVYYVEAKCSGTETSDPSSTFNFTTECDAFTITATDKYTQDFESPVVTSTYNSTTDLHVPSCWENPYTTGSSAAGQPHLVKAGASYNYSTGQVLLFYGSGYNYVTLPEFTNALNELQITFKWATESSSYGTLTLGYITDGDVNYNTFTEIAGASYPASSSSYHTMLQADPVYLNTLPATAKRLVFRWYYSGQYSCNVDDVEVSLMPSCYPIGTLTYDNLASQTVDLHWTLVDATQDAWQVCLNNDETNLIDITTTDVTISGNAVTYSLSGLTAETAYTVKVRANCGGSDFSDWSNTVSFTTLAACATPTGLAASNLTQNGANLAWTGSSDVAAYTVQYRTAAGLQTHYFEGFEDGLGDWTKVDCASSTGISTGSSYAHTGNAAFKFSYNTNPPQYLVSPAISGITSGMQLEFWYKNGSTSYSETFQVGFSSTDNDVASFAFEDEITASDAQWHSYSVAVPATTKYLCFKLNSNDQLSLYIDDITIGAMVAAGTWQTAANDVTAWNYELAGLTASVKYDARVYANCTSDPETENSMTTFTTLADGTMVFTNASGDGMWSTADNWTPGIPTISDNAVLRANATITGAATANKITFEGTTTPTLTINDGGTLQTNTNVTATVKKHITGYTAAHHDEAVGYYLIANPLNSTVYYSNFATVGLTSGSYDIYSWSYSGEDGKEWRNFRASNFSLATQTGYLYANESDVDFTFTGTVAANNADVTKSLNYASSGSYAFNGWNLVGNPFACNAYTKDATSTDIAFYRMNNAGSGFEAATGAIKPMEGIFVKATATGQSFKFTREQPSTGYGNGNLNISLANVVTSRDAVATTDKAIVRFDGGGTLEKFMFREDNMKIYIPQDGTDFAVVASEAKGVMPVNVKVTTTGEYTISISNEDVDLTYLHLIDRLTGEDVDLLIEDSYTFYASPRDQENRFTLVFNSIDGNIDATSEIFAYQNGNQIIVSGEGTLQVYDVMGRFVANYNVNGTESINASQFENAVYIFRLVGTDVKTQKIVIR